MLDGVVEVVEFSEEPVAEVGVAWVVGWLVLGSANVLVPPLHPVTNQQASSALALAISNRPRREDRATAGVGVTVLGFTRKA